MAMYIFTKKILKGKPISIFNKGKMKRDFTYIDDIINGVKASIENNYECEVFNLGNSRSESLMEVVSILESNLGKKAIIEYEPLQPGDVKNTCADIEKSKDMLGFSPKTNIELGIELFVNWYKNYTWLINVLNG